jgi:uncharacterized membrane protein
MEQTLMTILIVGLLLFLGVHSVRIFADGWRSAQIARIGLNVWKALYSLVSLSGFALIVWGYGMTRAAPVELWSPPGWMRHPASVLMLVSFILLVAAYVPRNRIKSRVGHPMVIGVKVWAFAHLLTNGRLGDVVLFGALLVWAVLDFRAARQRDRANETARVVGTWPNAAIAVVIGIAAWVVFARYLHESLIGVPVA